MDRNFIIHIWDLLAGKTLDSTITFQDKFSTRIPWMIKWIHWDLLLQCGDSNTILLNFWGFSCTYSTTCDKCGQETIQKLRSKERQTKRMKGVPDELLKENDYKILDTSRINLEEVITEDLLLEKATRILCQECQKLVENIEDKNSENEPKVKVIRK